MNVDHITKVKTKARDVEEALAPMFEGSEVEQREASLGLLAHALADVTLRFGIGVAMDLTARFFMHQLGDARKLADAKPKGRA